MMSKQTLGVLVQLILNTCVGILIPKMNTKYAIMSLQFLPIHFRIDFKLCNFGPSYLSKPLFSYVVALPSVLLMIQIACWQSSYTV